MQSHAYLCISHHTRWLLENQRKSISSSRPFLVFHTKPLKTWCFSLRSHRSGIPSHQIQMDHHVSPLSSRYLCEIQVAHFTSQNTQTSPFDTASITAAGFVEQHVWAALLASTETGVIRKLTWKPQRRSQLQPDA